MKILFYNHTGKVSGAERVLLMILARLDRTRFDPVVVCPADGPLIDMVRQLDVRITVIDQLSARFTWRPHLLLKYLRSFIHTIRETRHQVIEEAPGAVHANSIRSGLVMSAATIGLRLPIIWHVHDLLPRHPLSSAIRFFSCVSRRNRIVAVSHAVANRFCGRLVWWFPRRVPVNVIHNGIDVERFQPNAERRKQTRQSLGFPGDQILIGSVGQLTARKGQLELIQAFAEIAGRFPNTTLLIAGEALFNRDFEYADSLKRLADTVGIGSRINFLGQTEDVPALMRAFDLLIVNSRAEPFGLIVTEAMASRTPVLATAVDGIKEIIDHSKSGWLVESGSHLALVAALRALVANSNLRRQLSEAGLAEVRHRFTADRFLNDIQNLYRSISTVGEMPHTDRARKLAVKLRAD